MAQSDGAAFQAGSLNHCLGPMRKVGNYALGTDEEWRSIDLQEASPVQEGEGGAGGC